MTPFVQKSVTDPAVNKWASFMPTLLQVFASTQGPVLEVGVGHYSTGVLHELCEAMCRPLTSVEEEPGWAQKFGSKYSGGEGSGHQFIIGNYDEIIPYLSAQEWGMVFLDHSPGPRRAKDMKTLSKCTDYFVVHDYLDAIAAEFDPIKEGFSYWVKPCSPPTMIASYRHDVHALGFLL